jgi:uncharacterized protein YndB with AHSA1/START domain
MERLRLATTLLALPKDVFDAWITAKGHAAMTGAPATSEKKKGGAFTAWDGYISGTHLELVPEKRILQSWRTTEFPAGSPDSRLEVRLARAAKGTRLTILQSGIPDGQSEQYESGWQTHYFDPMTRFFEATWTEPAQAPRTANPTKTAQKKKPSKKTLPKGKAPKKEKKGPPKKSAAPAPKKKKASAKKKR